MKKARTETKGVTQTSNNNARSSSAEALRPNSGNTEKRGTSTKQTSCGLDTPVAPLITTRSHEQITERAKALWTQHGCVAGQDQADWYEAEAQLRTES